MSKIRDNNQFEINGKILFSSPNANFSSILQVDSKQQQPSQNNQNQKELLKQQDILNSLTNKQINSLNMNFNNQKLNSNQNKDQLPINIAHKMIQKEKSKNQVSFFDKLKQSADEMINDTKIFFEKNVIKGREMCYCSPGLNKEESCSKAIIWMKERYKEQQFKDLKTLYNQQKSKKCTEINASQIEKDIERTYPNTNFYKNEEQQIKLKTILQAFSTYDPQIGYVQGMNYIAGVLLYHAEEYMAFWILVIIFENIGVRDNYLPEMPGLFRHVKVMDQLLQQKQKELQVHLSDKLPIIQFATPWTLSLFGSIIRFEDMGLFLDLFIRKGWKIFYQVFLKIMEHLSDDLLDSQDIEEIMVAFSQINYRMQDTSYFDWKDILKEAQQIEIEDYNIKHIWDQVIKNT